MAIMLIDEESVPNNIDYNNINNIVTKVIDNYDITGFE